MRLGLGIGVSVAKAAAAAPTAPTDISLSAASLGENSAQATTIGILSATGGTAPYTFSLTDSSSNKVQITGTTLQAGSAAVNFESVTSFNCTVRVTDANTLTFDEVFAITVTNVNETPTDVALSAATLAENSAQGTTIGTLSFTDPDASASGTFTLTDNAGNKVQITGTTLQAGSVAADFETTPSFNCTVLFTDQGGLTRSEVFAITVTDVAEFEAESTALFARMTPTPDATRQGHINTLIAGLKTDGVWTRLHRLWLLAAHSANAARQDWIADTTDLVDVGTPTFTTDRGFAFPGAAATALTTGFSLATNIGAPALGNHSFGGWCTGHTAGGCIIGHTSGRIQTQTAAGAPFTRCSDTTTSGPAHTVDARNEFCALSRDNSGTNYQSQVGTEAITVAVVESSLAGAMEIGRIGTAATNTITGSVVFAFVGQSLSKAQRDALRSRVRTYLVAVGVTLP